MIHRAFFGLLALVVIAPHLMAEGLPIAQLDHPDPVSFEKELLPVLRKKCLACHNETDAESEFVAESPESILRGGASGPSVVAGDAENSLMLTLAAHRDYPIMPPEDNPAGAEPMTPEELALLRLWIQQGAKAGTSKSDQTIAWQALPKDMKPVLATAQSPDGRFIAAGRGNEIVIHDLLLNRWATRLTDPALDHSPVARDPGIAHLDLVQALAFRSDGRYLASGGYRTLKLWRRVHSAVQNRPTNIQRVRVAAVMGDRFVLVGDKRELSVYAADGTPIGSTLFAGRVHAIDATDQPRRLAGLVDERQVVLLAPEGEIIDQSQLPDQERRLTALALGSRFVVAATDENRLLVWPISESGMLQPHFLLEQLPQSVRLIQVINDNQLVSITTAGTLAVWDLSERKRTQQWKLDDVPTQVAASGSSIVSITDGKADLWNSDQGKKIGALNVDPTMRWRLTESRLRRQIAKRHVDNVEQDLQDARERLDEEEANLKKTIAARDKAQNEFKAAQERAEETSEALRVAEMELDAARRAAKRAAEHRDELAERSTSQGDSAEQARAAADEAVSKAEERLKKAEENVNSRREAAQQAKKEVDTKRQAAESAQRTVDAAQRTVENARKKVQALEPELKIHKQQLAAAVDEVERRERQLDQFAHHTTCAAVNDGGTLAVTCNADGHLLVFDARTGEPVASRETGVPQIVFLTIGNAHDAIVVRAATRDGHLVTHHLSDKWELTRSIGTATDSPFSDRVTALAFSPDGTELAIGGGQPSRDGEVHILRVDDGRVVRHFENAHSDTVFGLAYSPDGQKLASCGADRFMKVFDARSGELLRDFEGHTHHVLCVSWRADGRVLATGGADKLVKIWDAVDGSQIETIQGFGKEVVAIQFAGTSDTFFAVSGDHHLYRCQVDGKRESIGRGSDFLYALSVNAEGDQVVFAGHDSVIRVVDRDGESIAEF